MASIVFCDIYRGITPLASERQGVISNGNPSFSSAVKGELVAEATRFGHETCSYADYVRHCGGDFTDAVQFLTGVRRGTAASNSEALMRQYEAALAKHYGLIYPSFHAFFAQLKASGSTVILRHSAEQDVLAIVAELERYHDVRFEHTLRTHDEQLLSCEDRAPLEMKEALDLHPYQVWCDETSHYRYPHHRAGTFIFSAQPVSTRGTWHDQGLNAAVSTLTPLPARERAVARGELSVIAPDDALLTPDYFQAAFELASKRQADPTAEAKWDERLRRRTEQVTLWCDRWQRGDTIQHLPSDFQRLVYGKIAAACDTDMVPQ